jgi:hypothetical protein
MMIVLSRVIWAYWVTGYGYGIPYKYSFEEKRWVPVRSDGSKSRKYVSLVGEDEKQRKEEGKIDAVQVRIEEDEDKYSKVEEDRVIEWIRDVQAPIVNLIDDGNRLQGSTTTKSN